MHPILLGFLITEDTFYFPHPPTHFPRAPTPLEGAKTIRGNNTRQLFSPHFHEWHERCLTYKAVRRLRTNKQRNGLWAARCDPSKTAAQCRHPSWRFFGGSGHLNQSKCSDSKAALQYRENTFFFFLFFFCSEAAVVAYSEQHKLAPPPRADVPLQG